ncbi:hypothetical protein H5410_024957 [Solanum commersonii]|uniref:Uncharacterized protein n=1 Tax=Solanum commersonii TaxID=4109 RepID=A0A9J5ZNJ4_SOLCO|nr:hypothetical protein H5410_024957 [Solanum commersonii]
MVAMSYLVQLQPQGSRIPIRRKGTVLWLYIGRVIIKGFCMKHKLGSIQIPLSPGSLLFNDKHINQNISNNENDEFEVKDSVYILQRQEDAENSLLLSKILALLTIQVDQHKAAGIKFFTWTFFVPAMQQIQSRPGHSPIKAKPIRIECILGNPWIKETNIVSFGKNNDFSEGLPFGKSNDFLEGLPLHLNFK